ncbi:MAG TPA: 2-phospho-L-lactate guanylyltransferase [Ktedonobacterales bacterium]|nr:2-phospho-L-lactate guanylyltransferase [Ktedonobacterales bacterium]
MKLAAIVPLNSRAQVKTRLSSVLDAVGRANLSRWLAWRVISALHQAEIAHIGIVSPDDDILRWAWQSGAQPVHQIGSGLNDALELGRQWALRQHAEALLVVLGDLPLLTRDDVLAMEAYGKRADDRPALPSVTIASDRAGKGTNMLLLHPPTAISFAFGEASLVQHSALARAAGIEPRIVSLPGAAFDVDTPDDLRELFERGLWRPSATYPHPRAGEAS